MASINEPVTLDGIDLVVAHRPATAVALQTLRLARQRGVRVVVDIDDLFLPGSSVVLSDENPASHSAAKILYECLQQADAVTVSTEPLAEAYRGENGCVRTLENCFDDSNPLWSPPLECRDGCTVGFAGSATHAGNLALLRGVLEPVLAADSTVRLVEAGGPALLPLVQSRPEQLIHLGSLPFATFPLLLREMDVILAPLADTAFNRCKSSIRCMTAGLVGAPVIASPVGAYREYVQHDYNGFHSSNAGAWHDAVSQLARNPALRSRLGAANREVAQGWAISRHIARWESLYAGLLDHPCRG